MTTKHEKQDEKDARKGERTEARQEVDAKAAEKEAAAAAQAAAVAQAEELASRGRPFPSQAEQDRFAKGERDIEFQPDGSPLSPHGKPVDHRLGRKTPEEEELEKAGFKKVGKDAEPERGASYKTRQAHPEKNKED